MPTAQQLSFMTISDESVRSEDRSSIARTRWNLSKATGRRAARFPFRKFPRKRHIPGAPWPFSFSQNVARASGRRFRENLEAAALEISRTAAFAIFSNREKCADAADEALNFKIRAKSFPAVGQAQRTHRNRQVSPDLAPENAQQAQKTVNVPGIAQSA